MDIAALHRAQTETSAHRVVEHLGKNAEQFGFVVREVFDLRLKYSEQGHAVDDDFNAYQVMLCTFNYEGLRKNIERLAVLLPPKHVAVYERDGVTHVLYLPFSEDYIRHLLPDDAEFAVAQSKQCAKIVDLIRLSL